MFARLSQLFRSKRTPASNDAGAIIVTPDSLIIPDGTTMSWAKPMVTVVTSLPDGTTTYSTEPADVLNTPPGTTMSWAKPVVIDSTDTPFMGVQLRCKVPF